MKRLEVSGAVRPIYGSLGVKRLMFKVAKLEGIIRIVNCFLALPQHTVPSLHHMIHNNVTTLFLQKYDIHNKSGILSIKLLCYKYVFL